MYSHPVPQWIKPANLWPGSLRSVKVIYRDSSDATQVLDWWAAWQLLTSATIDTCES